MRDIELLNDLKAFVETGTKDLLLAAKPSEEGGAPSRRAAKVYLQQLPNKQVEAPYIVVQFVTGKDSQEPREDPESESQVRMLAATYEEDASKGEVDLLKLLTCIRVGLLRQGEVGQRFLLKKPLVHTVYKEQAAPYHLGEVLCMWEMPAIEREVMEIDWT